jgi:hypothetical protein
VEKLCALPRQHKPTVAAVAVARGLIVCHFLDCVKRLAHKLLLDGAQAGVVLQNRKTTTDTI